MQGIGWHNQDRMWNAFRSIKLKIFTPLLKAEMITISTAQEQIQYKVAHSSKNVKHTKDCLLGIITRQRFKQIFWRYRETFKGYPKITSSILLAFRNQSIYRQTSPLNCRRKARFAFNLLGIQIKKKKLILSGF